MKTPTVKVNHSNCDTMKYSVNISRNLSINVQIDAASEEAAQNLVWENILKGDYETQMQTALSKADPNDDEIGNILPENTEAKSRIKALYIKYGELMNAMNLAPVQSEEYQSLKKEIEEVSFSIDLLEETL